MLMGDPRNRARMQREAVEAQARQTQARSDSRRFVTFALGSSRFALDSRHIMEVVMPDRVYSFPHTTPSLDGVLVRRGTAIPVCNVVRSFGDNGPCSRYLIAQSNYRGASYSVAIPVSGDCELVQGEREDTEESSPVVTDVTFVSGLLRTADGTVPLLDMDEVVAHCIQPQHANGAPDLRAFGRLGMNSGRAGDPTSAGVPGWNELGGKEARQ